MDVYIDSLLEGRSLKSVLDQFIIDESVKEKRLEIADYLKSKNYSEEEIPDLVAQIIDIDPTTRSGKHEYIDQILKWIDNGKVILPEDYETAKNATRNFFKMQKKSPILRDKNIEDFNSPGEIQKLIDSGKKKTKRQNRTESFDLVSKSGEYSIWKVEESHKDVFCKLAQATEWCVKDPEYFDEYGAPYYYIAKGGSPFALLHVESSQFKDTYDDAIGVDALDDTLAELIRSSVKLPHVDSAGSELYPLYTEADVRRARSYETMAQYAIQHGKRLEYLESVPDIAERLGAHLSLSYAENAIKGPWPEAEDIIAQNARKSLSYARDVLGGRFKKGEEKIIKSKDYVYHYATQIIPEGERWPEAEETLLQGSGAHLVAYVRRCVRERWPEAEKRLLDVGTPADLVRYATSIIKGRWPEAEGRIITGIADAGTVNYAMGYAEDIVKEPWDLLIKYMDTLKRINPEAYKRYSTYLENLKH